MLVHIHVVWLHVNHQVQLIYAPCILTERTTNTGIKTIPVMIPRTTPATLAFKAFADAACAFSYRPSL